MFIIIEVEKTIPVIRIGGGGYYPSKDIILHHANMEQDEQNRLTITGDLCLFEYFEKTYVSENDSRYSDRYIKVEKCWKGDKYYIDGWVKLSKTEKHKYTFSNYIIDEWEKL